MKTAMPWLISLAALATTGVLVAGIVNMFRKDQNPARAQMLMRWRIGLQVTAVALALVFMILIGR